MALNNGSSNKFAACCSLLPWREVSMEVCYARLLVWRQNFSFAGRNLWKWVAADFLLEVKHFNFTVNSEKCYWRRKNEKSEAIAAEAAKTHRRRSILQARLQVWRFAFGSCKAIHSWANKYESELMDLRLIGTHLRSSVEREIDFSN